MPKIERPGHPVGNCIEVLIAKNPSDTSFELKVRWIESGQPQEAYIKKMDDRAHRFVHDIVKVKLAQYGSVSIAYRSVGEGE